MYGGENFSFNFLITDKISTDSFLISMGFFKPILPFFSISKNGLPQLFNTVYVFFIHKIFLKIIYEFATKFYNKIT